MYAYMHYKWSIRLHLASVRSHTHKVDKYTIEIDHLMIGIIVCCMFHFQWLDCYVNIVSQSSSSHTQTHTLSLSDPLLLSENT